MMAGKGGMDMAEAGNSDGLSGRHRPALELLGWLEDRDMPTADAEQLLEKCLAVLRDRAAIEVVAPRLGLTLVPYAPEERLSVMYDLVRVGELAGTLFTGWDEPGYRLGVTIHLPMAQVIAYREAESEIRDLCNRHMVSIEEVTDAEDLELSLAVPLYRGGFSEESLMLTLDTLGTTVAEVRKRIGEEP